MKKKLLTFATLTVAFLAPFLTGCNNEMEQGETEKETAVQELKMRILRIAAEYGFEDFTVNESSLINKLGISDEQIAKEMGMYAYIPGTYRLKNDGKGKFIIKEKISKRHLTRGIDDNFTWPENEKGSFEGRDSHEEDYLINGSFDYSFGQSGPDDINSSFEVSCWEAGNNENSGRWGNPVTGKIIFSQNLPPTGNIDNASIECSYVIAIETSKDNYMFFAVNVSGTHGQPYGTMISNRVNKDDPRVKSWLERKNH